VTGRWGLVLLAIAGSWARGGREQGASTSGDSGTGVGDAGGTGTDGSGGSTSSGAGPTDADTFDGSDEGPGGTLCPAFAPAAKVRGAGARRFPTATSSGSARPAILRARFRDLTSEHRATYRRPFAASTTIPGPSSSALMTVRGNLPAAAPKSRLRRRERISTSRSTIATPFRVPASTGSRVADATDRPPLEPDHLLGVRGVDRREPRHVEGSRLRRSSTQPASTSSASRRSRRCC
jgi:hypothetical protein